MSGPTPASTKSELFGESLRLRLEQAQGTASAALLRERHANGTWTGELSASALSTATAITALTLVGRGDHAVSQRARALIERGYGWLVANQNADGGWGDTTRSISNISTTTLVWAALGLRGGGDAATVRYSAGAERWLTRASGSLQPSALVRAIEERYGDDRTFSIPILTMCALCGRLGPEREAWRHVRQLPFEIAALPQRWFGALQLPVVSYALPALIAIGQVRHRLRPTKNPVARAIREACREATLAKLERLQPPNGGFLEATPLTSFVTMSLAAIGLSHHRVVQRAVDFIESSARSDGSWPIDTNLATWVTTLSVNALGLRTRGEGVQGNAEMGQQSSLRSRAGLPQATEVRDWLLRQQYRNEHPYTLAAPGGWAWTDLPGGVPDADDTAGALLALLALAGGSAHARDGRLESTASRLPNQEEEALRGATAVGVEWLLDLQNRDGGVPTFCRGWGKLPFDRSSPDITAHALRAWAASRDRVGADLNRRIEAATSRAVGFLRRVQRPDGAWVPLWFGHQEDPADENPLYGTARVIPALCGIAAARPSLERALRWLVANQNSDGGWSGAAGARSSMEETGLALEALAIAWTHLGSTERPLVRSAIERGAEWLTDAVTHDRWHEPAPIGFYFAKLWYHERLYPLIFATAALTRLARL